MITVGTVVELRVSCLGNEAGTLGVGFNDYGSGCQVIFENGEYDGFGTHLDEQGHFLKEVRREDSLVNYRFTHVIKVSEDYAKGVFQAGFEK
jgi:hypothetical protein